MSYPLSAFPCSAVKARVGDIATAFPMSVCFFFLFFGVDFLKEILKADLSIELESIDPSANENEYSKYSVH